ncbi:MAG: bis(5'-nucleosyl)-tetraphosphatase (symmetrical) ApaH [Candidatus Dasytiphilus stammeri]
MATYLIGDIHGCYDELCTLLEKVNFDSKKDILWLTGDLVARGPNSLKVLRYIRGLGTNARIVLGNHDLDLLNVFYKYKNGYIKNVKIDFLKIIKASDSEEIIHWLRHQPLFQIDEEKKIVMSHAGISPQWDLLTAKNCALEIQSILTSNNFLSFLNFMYGDMPNNWSKGLYGMDRFRFITNVFTRMRYCYFPQGQLDLSYKNAISSAPSYLKPWFDFPNPILNDYTIVFGHWSYLRGKGIPQGIIGLDTGCCWGGVLTILCWEEKKLFTQQACNKIN